MNKPMNKKKVKQFIDSNFPPYSELTILEEQIDYVTVLLDYGKREEKLKVKIGYANDGYNLYRLLQTDFIK